MGSDADRLRIERLIQRQIREWDLRRRLAEEGGEAARREIAHLPEGPWVAIAKQLGSDARRIAKALGGKLGWQLFDKEIVETIALETHTRERILSRLDEKAVGRFDDLLSELVVPNHLDQLTFLREMGKVIWALARQGHVILLGRGANWFLDPRYGLRVRVVAPFDTRVARVSERERIGPKEAASRVRETDASRAAFIRQVYHRDIDDPLGYDLVLNTEALDIETAAETVHGTLRRKLGAVV
ncbi:MAG: cytidylate kinase-like family protein [Acidobacteriia bacterium]|nr:cytidylate kinase-like family protein [Terriglobia bacterium]